MFICVCVSLFVSVCFQLVSSKVQVQVFILPFVQVQVHRDIGILVGFTQSMILKN